jgi:hypothetical protein
VAFWIFKCNPEKYRLAERLADPNPTLTWQANQHREEIGPGDTAFIWKTGPERGICAVVRVETEPRQMLELETELKYDVEPDTELRWRVQCTLTNRNVNLSHVALREVPGLENLSVFRKDVVARGTNFAVTPDEGAILLHLAGGLEDGLSDEDAGQVDSGSVDSRAVVIGQIRQRRGQTRFRDALRLRYDNRCLVTGCEVLAVLEAAHIRTHPGEDDNRPENGLLLRSDIHTLFDLNLLGIEPESLRVELHPSVSEEYGEFAGSTLRCTASYRPSSEVLAERYEQFRQRLP